MIGHLFHVALYVPIYNLLISLVGIIPHGDVGLAVIAVTLIVNFIILPLSLGAVRTQKAVKLMAPELEEIKARLKDDKEGQAKETFALYKKYGVNPFASILTLLIQLPILLALYWVFRSHTLLSVDTSMLYSFVHVPAAISPLFLGIFSVTGHSITLAALAGIAQFAQALYAVPVPAAEKNGGMQADMNRMLALQMRYIFPFLMAAVGYTSGAIALYLITRTAVLMLQELFMRNTKLKAVA